MRFGGTLSGGWEKPAMNLLLSPWPHTAPEELVVSCGGSAGSGAFGGLWMPGSEGKETSGVCSGRYCWLAPSPRCVPSSAVGAAALSHPNTLMRLPLGLQHGWAGHQKSLRWGLSSWEDWPLGSVLCVLGQKSCRNWETNFYQVKP